MHTRKDFISLIKNTLTIDYSGVKKVVCLFRVKEKYPTSLLVLTQTIEQTTEKYIPSLSADSQL